MQKSCLLKVPKPPPQRRESRGSSLDNMAIYIHDESVINEKARVWVNQCRYKCQVCSMEIQSKIKMYEHVRKHNLEYWKYCMTHGDPTVSQVMHQCKICSAQFALNDKDAYCHLKRHGLGHMDYFITYIMETE